MRNIPTMTVFEPVDSVQLRKAMPQIAAHYGPVFIRLLRRNAEAVFDEAYNFQLGRADTLLEGKDAVIFATGIMVAHSLTAAKLLKTEGIDVKVVNIHTIKPIDQDAVISAAQATGAVVTAENHNVIGGLGSAVAEVLSENCPVNMQRVGVLDQFGEVGKSAYLLKRFHLTPDDIADAVRKVLKKKNT